MITWIARHGARQQSRDFLTYIYGVVFLALTVGFLATDAIELVSDRGAVPRTAPWSVTHAVAGLTAFGQLITAFVVATAALRDSALRIEPLVRTSQLTDGAYFVGRVLGAAAVMAAVYAMIPLGFVGGALLGGHAVPWTALATALLIFLLPNILVVSGLFFAVALATRRVGAIAVLGVSLIALWQLGLAWTTAGHARGPWIDPFGNALLQHLTASWDLATRTTSPIPWRAFVAHRVVWLTVAAGALMLGWRWRDGLQLARTPRASRPVAPPRALRSPAPPTPPWRVVGAIEAARGMLVLLRHEAGVVLLAAIGGLNVLAHAAQIPRGEQGIETAAVLDTIDTHFFLFAILLATIYAGELVWRDRDVRIAPLIDALGVGTAPILVGRVVATAGVFVLITAALAIGVASAELLRGDAVIAWPEIGQRLGAEFLPWWLAVFGLAVLMHLVVQHKVAAHFLLIATWVGVVAVA